jgi:hypothetical protein
MQSRLTFDPKILKVVSREMFTMPLCMCLLLFQGNHSGQAKQECLFLLQVPTSCYQGHRCQGKWLTEAGYSWRCVENLTLKYNWRPFSPSCTVFISVHEAL